MRFNHVAISVADLERSIDFYCTHFGMEKMIEPFPFEGQWYADIMGLDDPQGRMVMIGKNGMALELFEFHNPDQGEQDASRPVSKRGITHFGVEVDDIDEAYARMLAAGVRFHCPVLTFGTTTKAFYARDPDGNVFELVESLLPA
jgi:catechol 2,3-dioxygenase-like lactoylglutathione lyase family enzyme